MTSKPYRVGSVSLSDFKQLSLLGEGAYSAVYKVLRLADGEVYALKKVKLPSLSDKEKQNALNEVRLLASIEHFNVIAYKEAFFDDKTRCLCIITECADGGDLYQQIVRCQKERSHLHESDVWRYLFGMCHGLKALHDMRILHRDLKPANVFINSGPEGLTIAKLADFNVSKVAKRGLCMTQTGTPYYASPEVWRDMPYDAKSDMWSLGCVLYELLALKPPFRAEDMEGLYRKVLRGQYPRIPAHYSPDLSEVIAALLQVNPRHRPSVDQLLAMPVMLRHAPDVGAGFQGPNGIGHSESGHSDLLGTIKLPKNAIDLSGCLPKPRYHPAPLAEIPQATDLQESPGDVAAGTAPLRQSAVAAAALQRPPPPPPAAPSPLPQKVAPIDSVLPAAQAGGPHDDPVGPSVPDTLDAYMRQKKELDAQQQRDELGPAAAPVRGGANSLAPSAAHGLAGQRDASQGRGRHGRQEIPDYSNRYGGGGASGLPRYDADYSEAGRGSPAPSVAASAAPRPGRTALYAGGGAPRQHRPPREQRREMARFARPQYAMGAPPLPSAAAQPQSQALKQSGSSVAGLRLPRIFSRAG